MPEISEGFEDGWGPPTNCAVAPQLGICDFVEHLDKFPLMRIGRICDFSVSGMRLLAEKGGKGRTGKGAMKGKQGVPLPQPGKDDEGFSLVDNRPMPGKSAGRGRGGSFGGRSKGRGKGPAINYQEGILGQKQKAVFPNNAQKGGKGKSKGGAPRRGVPSFKEWSVHTKPEWEMKMDINLSALGKLQLDAKEVQYEDLMWCGKLHSYDKKFDRITAKTESPMRRFEDLEFFNVSTTDDPHLSDLLQEDEGVCMIATDHVLACLIAASRSVYSWDIVVTKIQNKLIFDKRSHSGFVDFLSVNETAPDPPNADDKENINSPVKLSQEASCINQNFSQMVLDMDTPPREMEHANPFEPEEYSGTDVASGAYRYRKITIPGNPKDENDFKSKPASIIVRTEVNCRMPDAPEGKGYVSVKALNEYDPKLSYSWRTHLETNRGRCLATELTNNAFKLGRWTAQAILSGCDTMKIGYVSRQQSTDPWSHTVLGVQTHMTDGFAEQIGMTRNNMFGILRTIINEVMQWDDGKYLLLKDPMKSVLRLYAIPWETFKSDDEDDDGDDEEEEERELDEDGNVVPNSEGPVR